MSLWPPSTVAQQASVVVILLTLLLQQPQQTNPALEPPNNRGSTPAFLLNLSLLLSSVFVKSCVHSLRTRFSPCQRADYGIPPDLGRRTSDSSVPLLLLFALHSVAMQYTFLRLILALPVSVLMDDS